MGRRIRLWSPFPWKCILYCKEMIFCKKTNVRSFQYYVEICRHIFYLLEYSEFFFLSMSQFNWLTTPRLVFDFLLPHLPSVYSPPLRTPTGEQDGFLICTGFCFSWSFVFYSILFYFILLWTDNCDQRGDVEVTPSCELTNGLREDAEVGGGFLRSPKATVEVT